MESCPIEEELAAFAEGGLVGAARERVEAHLVACEDCLDVVAATLPAPVAATPADPPAAAPRPVPNRASARIQSSSRKSRKSAATRWRRWAVAAGVVLVGGGLLVGILRQPLLARFGPSVGRLAARWLGTGLHADAVTVRLGTTPGTFVVTLRDAKIGRDLHMFAKADEVGLTVALAAPVFGEPAITQVQVTGPVVELTGPNSLAIAWTAKERAQVLALLAQADRLDVTEGRLVVRGPGGGSFVVDHVMGGLERTAGGARVALQGLAAGGMVDVVGTLATDDARLALTIAGRDLDAAAIPLTTQRLTGIADLRLDVTSRGDDLRLDGRIAVRNGRVVGRGPTRLLPLDGETKATLASVAPALAGDDLAFDEARAMFAWRHGTWRLPRVFLTTGGTIAGGRARVDASGDVTGHGTVRLPSDVADRLRSHAAVLATFRDANGAATVPFGVNGRFDAPRFTLGRP